jgi:vacuolar protein-sorting-associated protein 4
MTWEEVPKNRLLEPPVTAEDFARVLRERKVKASVGVSELQRYEDWTEQFGVEGRG